MASELASLIVDGVKTATCSSVWEWDNAANPMPRPGLLTVVVDGAGTPRCIIETVRVERSTFDAVGAEFAFADLNGTITRVLAAPALGLLLASIAKIRPPAIANDAGRVRTLPCAIPIGVRSTGQVRGDCSFRKEHASPANLMSD